MKKIIEMENKGGVLLPSGYVYTIEMVDNGGVSFPKIEYLCSICEARLGDERKIICSQCSTSKQAY